MPKLEKVKDIDLALQRIVDNVGNGNITPAEAEKFTVILQNHRDNVQDREYEARLAEAEKKAPPKP